MFLDLIKGATNAFDVYKALKEDKDRNKLLKYAIIAEAKFNNDLAQIICRSDAKKMALESPHIYNCFSTETAETLLLLGIPAYKVLGESKRPKEENIKELNRSNTKINLYEKKTAAELYEFYIRKCNLLKALSTGNSLVTANISLHGRCKNIDHATRFLIKKCE